MNGIFIIPTGISPSSVRRPLRDVYFLEKGKEV